MTEYPLIYIFIYSLVQGVTEFIPISSSGHLNLLEILWKNSNERNLLFETTAHLSTIFALGLYLLNYYRGKILDSFKINLIPVIISVIPALIVGFTLKILNLNFISLNMIAITSIIGAIILFHSDSQKKLKFNNKSKSVSFLIAGLFQCLAFLPGFSRSGSCISAFLYLGYKRDEAILNSLLMSFPIIILSFLSNLNDFDKFDFNFDLILIFLISFVSAYLTLFFFIKYINKIGFTPYVIYRILLGIIIIFTIN